MVNIQDEKQTDLNEFVETYKTVLYSSGIEMPLYDASYYFTLNYNDSKGKSHNDIYTLNESNFILDNPERKIFGDDFMQLKKVSKIPNPDIIAPLKFDETCVISINYENAETQQLIENEKDYYEYLYAIFLDLIDSKTKPIEEMYGMAILSDGNLWMRNMNTGELELVCEDAKEFGFTE